ncbi:hypothetical protein ACLOJK_006966 [Asimina triloba]
MITGDERPDVVVWGLHAWWWPDLLSAATFEKKMGNKGGSPVFNCHGRRCPPILDRFGLEVLDRGWILLAAIDAMDDCSVPRWVLGSLDDRAIWPWTLFGTPLLLPNSCALPCSMKADREMGRAAAEFVIRQFVFAACC